VTTQLDLFQEAKVEIEKPEPMTEVRLGHRSARVPLRKQRKEALAKLMNILADLEGKDIYIGSYDAGGRHFWLDNLKLQRLQLEYHPFHFKEDTSFIPTVVVLWGSRGGSVRIFTDYLVAVREQDYQGYVALSSRFPQWLLGRPDRRIQKPLCLSTYNKVQGLRKEDKYN